MVLKIKVGLILLLCSSLVSGCSRNSAESIKLEQSIPNTVNSQNSKLSGKETIPFEFDVICPKGYVNNNKVPLIMRLKPDKEKETLKIEFESMDGVQLDADKIMKINNVKENEEKEIDFNATLPDINKGHIVCKIVVSSQNEVLYQMKREVYLIKTEDGILCSARLGYQSLEMQHLDKLKSDGRISFWEYKKRKKEIQRGGAKIESYITSPSK